MTRDLPQFPNIEHLRKQAKAQLRELRKRKPGAKLTEAQHAIAVDYGFASWVKLKAHVESLSFATESASETPSSQGKGTGGRNVATPAALDSPGPGIFPRFTERARRVIFYARYWAARRGSPQIESEDLLMGVVEEDSFAVNRLLQGPSSVEVLRHEVERRSASRESLPGSAHIPLSQDCRRILETAAEEADGLHQERIKPGHFLLGVLRQAESLASSVLADVLAERGISPIEGRRAIVQALLEESQ